MEPSYWRRRNPVLCLGQQTQAILIDRYNEREHVPWCSEFRVGSTILSSGMVGVDPTWNALTSVGQKTWAGYRTWVSKHMVLRVYASSSRLAWDPLCGEKKNLFLSLQLACYKLSVSPWTLSFPCIPKKTKKLVQQKSPFRLFVSLWLILPTIITSPRPTTGSASRRLETTQLSSLVLAQDADHDRRPHNPIDKTFELRRSEPVPIQTFQLFVV